MKDLTNTQYLLGKIKSFLNISWQDTETDVELTDFIFSSIRFLDETAGVELDYELTPQNEVKTTPADSLYNSMSYLGQDLLKNRIFYLREKALDDFSKNYQSDLVKLFNLGKIYKVNKNVEQ
ncbi:MAG: hypothetical protein KBT03_02230 [Bacteroidales bacterium]|nr:hypothetical protein [Candidatus Scybalousia scybalohippi]